MTEDDRNGYSGTAQADRVAQVLTPGTRRERSRRRGIFRRRRPRRRIRWMRLLAILVPLAFLALISFVFGIVLAYAPQVTQLTAKLKVQYTAGVNSTVYDQEDKPIGFLTSNNQVFLPPNDIPKIMAEAIVAIEDKRFYTEPGVDPRGIARAFIADVFHTGGGIQGASTITEQFVKIATKQQQNRTVLEKLREAAMAFQLSHLWSKQQILAEYLDVAYFGSGAYGVEAAAKAYFSADPASPLYGCGQRPDIKSPKTLCVTNLTADEAALLAAAVDAPSNFNGLDDASAALDRRNLVLRDMEAQGYLSPGQLTSALAASLPPPELVGSPAEEGTTPSDGYFVSWIENQMIARYGQKIFTAGYHIHTTLNGALQYEAQGIIGRVLPPAKRGPSAALVAIDNATGQVRAMVGGYDFFSDPYNLATEGERQPGSSFKVFDLAVALDDGYKPSTKVYSGSFDYTDPPFGTFAVRNDEHAYYDARIPLSLALAVSDNSVFSRVGLTGARSAGLPPAGPKNIAALANRFGISTTVSFNPAMVIGGLNIGVTPLDMAHAYETIAQDGTLVSGSLASTICANGRTPAYRWEENAPVGAGPGGSCPGPVGITHIYQPTTKYDLYNKTNTISVYSASNAAIEKSMMKGVLSPVGTAASAAIPGVAAWGKTGTTNNYADAWFVGSIPKVGRVPSMTVAVWVGYPTSDRSMAHAYHGHPVYGGTYPAEIWRDYILSAMSYYEHPPGHHHHTAAHSSSSTTSTSSASSSATTTTTSTNTTPVSNTGGAAAGANSGGTTTAAGGTSSPGSGTGTTVTSGGGSAIQGNVPATTTPATTTPATTTPATTTPATTTPATTTPATTTPATTAPSTGGAAAPGA